MLTGAGLLASVKYLRGKSDGVYQGQDVSREYQVPTYDGRIIRQHFYYNLKTFHLDKNLQPDPDGDKKCWRHILQGDLELTWKIT